MRRTHEHSFRLHMTTLHKKSTTKHHTTQNKPSYTSHIQNTHTVTLKLLILLVVVKEKEIRNNFSMNYCNYTFNTSKFNTSALSVVETSTPADTQVSSMLCLLFSRCVATCFFIEQLNRLKQRALFLKVHLLLTCLKLKLLS